MEPFVWAQSCGRKIWMIRRIGIVLRLQAEGVAALVGVSVLADYLSVQKIAGVELHGGLRRRNFEDAATDCIVGSCR